MSLDSSSGAWRRCDDDRLESWVNLYLYPGATDMCKQINGPALLVEEELHDKPFSGNVFLFRNRRCTHLKALYGEKNGFWLALEAPWAGSIPVAAGG